MKIVLTGGGTGGHVYPNLALAEQMRVNAELFYIGEIGGFEEKAVKDFGLPFYGISAVKFIRGLNIKNLLIPVKLLRSVSSAKKILKELSPDAVFSKGGYVALPVTIAAKKLKIPVIIHESDLTLGLANRISAKFADKILLSFPENNTNYDKAKVVGGLIRESVITAKGEKLFTNAKPTILAVGGSGGATELNDIIRQNLGELLKTYNVIHITGKGYHKPKAPTNYKAMVFSAELGKLMASADLVISRGGANALFEIAVMKKAALILPLNNAKTRGDQVENAEFFYKRHLINLRRENKTFIEDVNYTFSIRRILEHNLENSDIKDGKAETIKEIYKSVFCF